MLINVISSSFLLDLKSISDRCFVTRVLRFYLIVILPLSQVGDNFSDIIELRYKLIVSLLN